MGICVYIHSPAFLLVVTVTTWWFQVYLLLSQLQDNHIAIPCTTKHATCSVVLQKGGLWEFVCTYVALHSCSCYS